MMESIMEFGKNHLIAGLVIGAGLLFLLWLACAIHNAPMMPEDLDE